MTIRPKTPMEGNEAVASVAYRSSEVCAIYPITPASPMGEYADDWAAEGKGNIWGAVPDVVEMQSEAGAAAAVHGALQAGALATTFTASQGLLLMIPTLYKIAGELTPFCLHVAARTLATHALSIFGDHSDVMSCRQTGFALLASGSVQEAHDLALIAHAATLESRIPFIHFFDGFRTSHEISKIEELLDDDLRFMIDDALVAEHRTRALTPDRPVIRGTAQNPDAFFQAREGINGIYDACPEIVERAMKRLGSRVGREYGLFDYVGDPEAESVIIMMGSGQETAHQTVEWMNRHGAKVGLLKVRLFRPFAIERFFAALPASIRNLAVLDRTKEPGALGEPLYQDVVTALSEGAVRDLSHFKQSPRVIGGRYGLSSKEFTPAMVKAVFDEAAADKPKQHFTVGIVDDVTGLSLTVDPDFNIEPDEVFRAVFYGLGSDGTVGANKNSLKIIGDESDRFVQGYFVYDSKKSGAVTASHLRLSDTQIRAPYLIDSADFVACHSFPILDQHDVLAHAKPGGTLLLNAPFESGQVWDELPKELQQSIIDKKLRVFAIDAYKVAKEAGLGGRINTIMQTCFFDISAVLDSETALRRIKEAISYSYGKMGEEVVRRNHAAVDSSLANLVEISVPETASATRCLPPPVLDDSPDFVKRVTALMIAGKGDLLPVSAFPIDGTWPAGTSKWERRLAENDVPVWDVALCVQCNLCALTCPHAAIRAKVYKPEAAAGAPAGFEWADARQSDLKGLKYTLQVSPDDCTGCTLCVQICPAKDKSNPKHKAVDMAPSAPIREAGRENFAFFTKLPEFDPAELTRIDPRTSQLLEPLFTHSGACSGCGETPYLKLLSQLFGDRLLIANATGCSSIYGGNLPTTPYGPNAQGRGPAWSNSLFEDAGEFGFGFRLAVDMNDKQARDLLTRFSAHIGDAAVRGLLDSDKSSAEGLAAARDWIAHVKDKLAGIQDADARRLETLIDYLAPKSVWSVGGDGWAYDIGFGGLDHVMSCHRNLNALVLDTEVYSNTGGQQSKATPLGAAAKFASAGKASAKKDLGLEMMSYGHVYVARIAYGARPTQTVQAFLEAESYPGPSIIIAYSHCIAHGYDLAFGLEQQKLAVSTGMWPLYRFDPRRNAENLPPLQLDSPAPKGSVRDYMKNEARFRMVEKRNPERFKQLQAAAERQAAERFSIYQQLAGIVVSKADPQ